MKMNLHDTFTNIYVLSLRSKCAAVQYIYWAGVYLDQPRKFILLTFKGFIKMLLISLCVMILYESSITRLRKYPVLPDSLLYAYFRLIASDKQCIHKRRRRAISSTSDLQPSLLWYFHYFGLCEEFSNIYVPLYSYATLVVKYNICLIHLKSPHFLITKINRDGKVAYLI